MHNSYRSTLEYDQRRQQRQEAINRGKRIGYRQDVTGIFMACILLTGFLVIGHIL